MREKRFTFLSSLFHVGGNSSLRKRLDSLNSTNVHKIIGQGNKFKFLKRNYYLVIVDNYHLGGTELRVPQHPIPIGIQDVGDVLTSRHGWG